MPEVAARAMRLVGEGGFGLVYSATQEDEKHVALLQQAIALELFDGTR